MRSPVEDKDQVATLIDDGLVFLIGIKHPRRWCLHHGMAFHKVKHGLIEGAHEMIFQVFIVHQRPLTTGVMVAPAVVEAREVDPFGMTKLIAHKVEPCLTAQGKREEANHLMQGDAAVDSHGRCVEAHGGVHLLVHQTEGNSLVAHQGLIVRFGVGHSLGLR